jgi:general L-amino acid transport system permease protein
VVRAAYALGLNPVLTTTFIILPQALRLVIPALLNSFISLFKDTSLVAIVGLFDRCASAVRCWPSPTGWARTAGVALPFCVLGHQYGVEPWRRRLETTLEVGKR